MTIKSVFPILAGEEGTKPSRWKIETDDSLNTILTTGYLTNVVQDFGYIFNAGDVVYIAYLSSNVDRSYILQVSSDNVSLVDTESFDNIEIYQTPPPGGTQICYFIDANTIAGADLDNNPVYHNGEIHAGTRYGYSGKFIASPNLFTTGTLSLYASPNLDDYDLTITNIICNQATTFKISDPVATNASFMISSLPVCDSGANLISFNVTVAFAALASGTSVFLYISSETIQYKIRSLWVNSGGTNFNGGGGDRLLSITDNTTVYSLVPAASLQTLANTGWGTTGLPYPASAAINTSTVAGASLVAKYSGGTTDYTAGSVVINGVLERVA